MAIKINSAISIRIHHDLNRSVTFQDMKGAIKTKEGYDYMVKLFQFKKIFSTMEKI